jgi:hypothetical protein
MFGCRPYCAAVGPNRTGVLASSGPQGDGGAVIVSVDASTAVTSTSALEYAVFSTLGWVRNGAGDSVGSVW